MVSTGHFFPIETAVEADILVLNALKGSWQYETLGIADFEDSPQNRSVSLLENVSETQINCISILFIVSWSLTIT